MQARPQLRLIKGGKSPVRLLDRRTTKNNTIEDVIKNLVFLESKGQLGSPVVVMHLSTSSRPYRLVVSYSCNLSSGNVRMVGKEYAELQYKDKDIRHNLAMDSTLRELLMLRYLKLRNNEFVPQIPNYGEDLGLNPDD